MTDKIRGYRALTTDEVATINRCKEVAVNVGLMCEDVSTIPGVDKRWLAIAQTDLQKGFMALIRSIAKPETF